MNKKHLIYCPFYTILINTPSIVLGEETEFQEVSAKCKMIKLSKVIQN